MCHSPMYSLLKSYFYDYFFHWISHWFFLKPIIFVYTSNFVFLDLFINYGFKIHITAPFHCCKFCKLLLWGFVFLGFFFFCICLPSVLYNFCFRNEFQNIFPNSEASFRIITYWLLSWPTRCYALNKLLCLKFKLELQLHVKSSGC